MDKAEFERLYLSYKSALERFVYYKISSKADADDILQDAALTAYKNRGKLKNPENFRAWIIRITQNKCSDFYRRKYKKAEVPLDDAADIIISKNRCGICSVQSVRETVELLPDKDKEILTLCYFYEKSQSEIASILKIPEGTVKSRLHSAKKSFKSAYPFPPVTKGDIIMKTLPEIMPEYKITGTSREPFPVKWEEMMGWFIIPRLGEKITWAMYDFPKRNRTEITVMEVVGKAAVHGVEGVEIRSIEYNPILFNQISGGEKVERIFIAQLTDKNCRILAESHIKDDVRNFFTFLDGDEFLPNWGFGEDNCGTEVNLTAKGQVKKSESAITCPPEKQIMDIVGVYDLEINGKLYETVCLIDIELYNTGVFAEQYIDRKGRTVLWRRFNKNDWHMNHYKKLWTEMMPDNETVLVNGETYVHWYDCITDYLF